MGNYHDQFLVGKEAGKPPTYPIMNGLMTALVLVLQWFSCAYDPVPFKARGFRVSKNSIP
jgi:hypothetical protein